MFRRKFLKMRKILINKKKTGSCRERKSPSLSVTVLTRGLKKLIQGAFESSECYCKLNFTNPDSNSGFKIKPLCSRNVFGVTIWHINPTHKCKHWITLFVQKLPASLATNCRFFYWTMSDRIIYRRQLS